ncbi:MAG: hypothetical protein IJ739_02995 [Bacteroidaceae bacterium]|nr:hypothetical protein [Bacteroidaceae bacterium]
MHIENNQECFVELWLRLEHTRLLLAGQCKRFCARRVLKMWFGLRASDDFIWDVCHRATLTLSDEREDPILGWDILPPPSRYPRKHRELLRAIVAVRLDITMCQVNLRALDRAYSVAFPHSTPLNVNKKAKLRGVAHGHIPA